MLYLWSCFFLTLTSILCAVGLLSRTYKDNLVQCAGMCLLMLACPSRVADIWAREFVPPDWFMVHAGVGLFALGVFIKVCMRQRHEKFLEFQRKVGKFAAFSATDTDWDLYIRGLRHSPPPDRRRVH